jgi:hypothetical protein
MERNHGRVLPLHPAYSLPASKLCDVRRNARACGHGAYHFGLYPCVHGSICALIAEICKKDDFSMPVSIGRLTIDEAIVSKQLRNDFKDDWFPDPLGYDDYFDKGLISEIIKSNFDGNHGEYKPVKASLLNIPKSNFTLRYALETSVTDRAVYHALAAKLLPLYDPLISWKVFSHRKPKEKPGADDVRSDPKYTFRNGVTAWSDFSGCVHAQLVHGKYLLSTDLANYFENIDLSVLSRSMIDMIPELTCEAPEKAEVREQVVQLFGYLSNWTYRPERGLPQNRDASSFLANLYMRSVDNAMIAQGYEYFRYMDDIKIVCDDEPSARRALKQLILELRPLGQFVNSGKTAIIPATDTQAVKKHVGTNSLEMKRIDSAWRSRSLKPISRTFLPLKKLTLKTLSDSSGYDSREFRFCINRLESLARCVEFGVPADYFKEITALVIEGLDRSPVSTDQICRYLRAVQIDKSGMEKILVHLVDPGRAIYNWKNYRLWVLLAQKRFDSDEARDLARTIISNEADTPTRAGATIYLGLMGTQADRNLIAERFESLSSFLGQRSAIIGAHELHFKPPKGGGISISSHVGPFLRADLKGAYRALNRAGTYVSEVEPMLLTRFVDLERDYD